MVEIGADTFDPGGVQLVDAPISDLPVEDQFGVFQDAQMLGNGRSTDRQAFSDLVGGAQMDQIAADIERLNAP